MKKTIMSIGVALMMTATIVKAEAPATQAALNANIPSCLQVYAEEGIAFYDCGKYIMKVDTHISGPVYRFITCNKDDDGRIGTCRYVDN